MRVLFVMHHYGFMRNFEHGIRVLLDRGHEVVLATGVGDLLGSQKLIDVLQEQYPRLSTAQAPGLAGGSRWRSLATVLRLGVDYLRYLEPRWAPYPALRQRAAKETVPGLDRLMRLPVLRHPRAAQALRGALHAVESCMPVEPTILAFLRAQSPDVLLLTPLVMFGSAQTDYVRAASRLGIPSAHCVASWDNLTTKGTLHALPDRLMVWNPLQVDEAEQDQGVPRGRVIVTGAHTYDHWFTWQPRPRADFLRRAGLPEDGRYLLYTCSSRFIAPDELSFVKRWLQRLRASRHAGLREVAVLVRPHPQNVEQWVDYVSDDPRLVVFPRTGENPILEDSRSDYFDSMHHSEAIVGINTSALLEAGIVGRPVLTVLTPEFAQEGTAHFHHLVSVDGGLLRVAHGLDEHEGQLRELLDGQAPPVNPEFIRTFLRPHGLDVPAAPLFADAVERTREAGSQPAAPNPYAPLVRAAASPLAFAAGIAKDVRRWLKRRSAAVGHAIPARPGRDALTAGVSLTICTVVLTSHRERFRLSQEMVRDLAGDVPWRWLVVDNSLAGTEGFYPGEDERFEAVRGVPFAEVPDVRGRISHHHAMGLARGLARVDGRFLLVLDPDFYLVRPRWAEDVIAHMIENDLAFFGAPWHPRWFTKYRGFPAVHCLFVDLSRVDVADLDFTPDLDYDTATPFGGEQRQKLEQSSGAGTRALLEAGRLAVQLTLRRRLVGCSHDTGHRIYEAFHPVTRSEVLQPVVNVERDFARFTHLRKGWRALERLVPERWRYLPMRDGYFSEQQTEISDLGWEEFMWKGEPFGFHLRTTAQDRSRPDRDPAEEIRRLESVLKRYPT